MKVTILGSSGQIGAEGIAKVFADMKNDWI